MPLGDLIKNLLWLPTRVEKGQKDLVAVQFGIQLASSIAITVATGVYLWGFETKNHCSGPDTASDVNDRDNYINVSKRFEDILKIWFSFAIADVFRCFCVFGFLIYKAQIFAWVYHVLVINDFYGVAAVLLVHIYRL